MPPLQHFQIVFIISHGGNLIRPYLKAGGKLQRFRCFRAAGMQDFMKQLQTTRIVACSEAAWRFLGLSLAGWNALASAGLFLLAVLGLLRGRTAA